MKSFPELAQEFSFITIDLQAHGRTADIPDRPLSIDQHAKDVVGVLDYLGIPRSDFFGESYGNAIATMIAVRYPQLVGPVATYGATFGSRKEQSIRKGFALPNLPRRIQQRSGS